MTIEKLFSAFPCRWHETKTKNGSSFFDLVSSTDETDKEVSHISISHDGDIKLCWDSDSDEEFLRTEEFDSEEELLVELRTRATSLGM